jgi:prolyl 4-hydroxylase
VGQFYRVHHDQNSGLFTPQGARVYTFFMYLNTPPRGGGTRFANLREVVPAVKGSVVLWPSVMSDDPDRDEPMTNHEALPVEEGQKFAANGSRPAIKLGTWRPHEHPRRCSKVPYSILCSVWIHNFDYRTPSQANCLLTHKNTH